MSTDGTSRYKIVSVIGRGGFGTVYRAVLDGPAGFTRDVAIKLLSDPNPPSDVLERFRDEARILGLVRDRAVVHVEPPQKFGDRWAVVMEYVDGVSLRRLIRGGGPLPAAIAVQITQELARALHRLWNQLDPGGRPLQLRHRDLKPDNVQITSDGSVMLLDFGIAKGEFSSREAQTRSAILGTEGYIAPERFYGTDGEKTDVFSLGVILWEMLHGKRPTRGKGESGEPGTLFGEASRLALELASIEEDERPTPRQVERRCEELLRTFGQELSLRDWAESTVLAQAAHQDDPLVGHVLSGTLTQPTSTGTAQVALLAGGTTALVLGVAAGAVVLLVLAILVGSWLAAAPPSEPMPVPVAPREVPRPPPVPEVVAPEPVPEPVPEPPPVPPVPVMAQPPKPPKPPKPLPDPEAPLWPIGFASIPADAAIFVDGVAFGTTPLRAQLPEGTHTVRLELGDRQITRTIDVGKRGSTRFVWKVEEDRWEASR